MDWDKERGKTLQEMEAKSFQNSQFISNRIAHELDLTCLRSGKHTIRNERNWRENEKEVEYAWLVQIDRSFVGFGGLFSVKFSATKYRNYDNPAELVQGAFLFGCQGVDVIYMEKKASNVKDPIASLPSFNLFKANNRITLDGIIYKISVSARNIQAYFEVNNPDSLEWNIWEKEIWELGKQLSKNAKNQDLIALFD